MHDVNGNGARIPAIGLGTWTLHGDECRTLVERALAEGYRHIDTASMYDNEEAVGEGIARTSVPRDEIFVTTKIWPSDIGAGDLEHSVEASLSRLALDNVDLALIHWPNEGIRLEESIDALNRVHERGLARHIGVANFPSKLLIEAVRLSSVPLANDQVEYHPFLNQDKVLDACRRNGIAVTAYCPLGRAAALTAEPIQQAAEAHGKTPAQVVLRWHIQQEIVAIPRTSRPERLAENIAIFDFELSADEMAAIASLRSRNERICDPDTAPEWDQP